MVKPGRITCDTSEEEFLRRLGGAVVKHWDAIDEETRNRLLGQATVMIDREGMASVQLRERLEIFIARHKDA